MSRAAMEYLVPGPDRWRSVQVSILCLAPVVLLATWVAMLAAKGPYWLGTNLDPDYVYLLNGLSILGGHVPAHVDHPGTPLQVLVALVIKVTHLLTGSGPVVDDVIRRPEHYLFVANGLLLVMFAGALVVAGLAALRTTRSLLAALAMQLVPGLSPLIALHVVCVKPEPLLAALTALLAALVLRRLEAGRRQGRVPDAALFGLLVGLAVATKITAAPLVVVPLILLTGLATRALFVGVTALTMALATFPAWPALKVFGKFISGIATHSGQYGSGRPSLIDAGEYLGGLKLLLLESAGVIPVAVWAVGVVMALALAWRSRRDGPASVTATREALFATVAMQAVSYLAVARHAASHYVLPAVVLAGLTAALAIHGLYSLEPVAWRTWRVGGVLVAALLAVAGHRLSRGIGENRAWLESRRDAQFEVVARLKTQFPDARVIHHYRSSSLAYALHFGDMYTGSRWSKQIKESYPNHLFYNLWNDRLEVYSPRPGGSSDRPLDYVVLTPEILCGVEGETPAIFQGSPLQDVPATVQDIEPLGQRLQLVHSSGVEALYRPLRCARDAPGTPPRPIR